VCLPCGSRNPLWLRHLRCAFLRKSLRFLHFRISQAFLPNPILLSGQRARLAQAPTAPPLGARGDAGVLLLFGECSAVVPGSSAKMQPPVPLLPRTRVFRLNIPAPALFVATQVAHVVAAPATRRHRIETPA